MPARLIPLGDAALLLRVGDSLGKVLAAVRKLEAARLRGVVEIAPAFASVAVFFGSPAALEEGAAALETALRRRTPRENFPKPRLLEVPVCYDTEFGLDLEAVAEQTRLSPHEIALRHVAARYEVRCVGFTPGFPYLGGLPRALVTPRKATPRTRVPPGSVAIGGRQTGIYPLASPGGWNVIGRTPLRLFDSTRAPAALLRAGDRVRFVAIDRATFARWEN